MIRLHWRNFCLWFCQRQYDGAVIRGDKAEMLYWQDQLERVAGWGT